MFSLYIISFLLSNIILNGASAIFIPNLEEVYCAPPIPEIARRKQILFFDYTNSDNSLYDICLYKRTLGQSVLLLNNNTSVIKYIRKVTFATHNPNIVIVVNDLSLEIFDHRMLSFMFESHRSWIFFIIKTKNSAFKCNQGVFSDDAHAALENFLNILWHKYRMFAIVVEFPFVCPHFFIIHEGKTKKYWNGLYNRTIKSVTTKESNRLGKILKEDAKKIIQGYPIRANLFERFPTSIYTCENTKYYAKVNYSLTQNFCGMDAFVMQDVLYRLKFNATFPDLPNDDYGFYATDTNITGSLGHLLRDEFDISFNSRFMVKYGNRDLIKFLYYSSFDSICAVMKAPDHRPLWSYPFGCFDLFAWMALLAMMVFVGIAGKLITFLKNKMNIPTTSFELIDYVTTGLFGCMVGQIRGTVSILRAACLISSIIILSLFQGHVNYVYTTMVRNTQISTLAELKSSSIEIHTKASLVALLGSTREMPLMFSNLRLQGNNLTDLMDNENWATLQRKSDVMLEALFNFTNDDGTLQLYVIEECFRNYYLSCISRKDFPFANDVILLMMHLVEAGLTEAYYRWNKNSLGLKTYVKYTGQMARPFTPTTMEEQRIAFSLLLIGYLVSTCVYIMERRWARRTKLRDGPHITH